jgi:UDP-N-acetylmuramoylalanine--D-glutamate ligase
MEISDKNIVILGAARSGLAAAELAVNLGARVFVSDNAVEKNKLKQINKLKGLGIPFEFGGHSNRVYSADFVVLSPGISQNSDVVQSIRQKGIPVFSEIEFAFRFCKSPIIAVTGSNGKTTTTTLIGEMLKKQMSAAIIAGNIGSPFSSYVLKSKSDSWAAVEVSSFQLETIEKFHPRIAIILNLSPNHLDWYETYDEYITAKLRIIMNLDPDDFLIYDGDDPGLADLIRQSPAHKLRFSARTEQAEAFTRDDKILFFNREFIATDEIVLKGQHNYKNIMAAGLACLQAGISDENIKDILRKFAGVEHRLEHVASINGVHFINDSKATTLESLAVALESFNTPILLIAGGKDKGADYSTVNSILKSNVRHVFLIGAAREKIAQAWEKVVPVSRYDSLEAAVKNAFDIAGQDENVLLSPACSSFDMFMDFEDRGKNFKKIVKKLNTIYEN